MTRETRAAGGERGGVTPVESRRHLRHALPVPVAAIALLAAACGGGASPSSLVGPSGVNGTTGSSRIDGGCAVPGTPGSVEIGVREGRPVLAWGAVEDATDYIVTVGTAPGLSDAIFTNTPGTSYPLGGLGRGRYFARVHAHNWCGTSDPSSEVAFTVG
jgi:hypothetical protein